MVMWVVVRRQPATMNLEDLYRAVYEAPGDDSRKHVLADALQTQGDPRGDFIALQLRGSVIARRRSDKLLARHREAFLGALRTVVVNPVNPHHVERTNERWEKGFVAECTVRLSSEAAGFLEWATVQTLHLFEGPEPLGLLSPHLISLRSVLIYGSNGFAERAKLLLASHGNRTVRVAHVDVHAGS